MTRHAKAIFFEPHHDDVVLFASYSLLRQQQQGVAVSAVTILGDDVVRSRESEDALAMLGVHAYTSWQINEKRPDWNQVKERMLLLRDDLEQGDRDIVYVPAPEDDGHEHHNAVGKLAMEVFDNCALYLTYRRGHGRSMSDYEVEPERGWRSLKYLALSSYASQIERDDTRPWFASDDVLREWLK